MTQWRKNGKRLRKADGSILRCNVCPCGAPMCCADGGGADNLYLYGYFEGSAGGSNVPPGFCLPFVCSRDDLTPPGNFSPYGVWVTNGTWSGGAFSYNRGNYDRTGTIGCANVRLIGACGSYSGDDPVTSFQLSIDTDVGVGYGGPAIGYGTTTITTHFSGSTALCEPILGCTGAGSLGSYNGNIYSNGLYITDRDPSTGILCPDGSVIPITISFTVTVDDATGTPTPYTCNLLFTAGGDFPCFSWRGFLADCSPYGCTTVTLSYNTGDSLWHLTAITNGNLPFGADNHTWSGSSFPTTGNFGPYGATDDTWPGCVDPSNPGVGETLNPPFSVAA